jgi:hypothetical protein
MKDRDALVFFDTDGKAKTVPLSWPSPDSVGCLAPVERMRKVHKLFEAYFDSHFPMWDVQICFAAFDLDAALTLEDRVKLVGSLCRRNGLNHEQVVQLLLLLLLLLLFLLLLLLF